MNSATVIISFYNNIAWLKLVLAGLKRQSLKEFDVIISDDGSTIEAIDAINSIKDTYPYKIKHIWHADNGWQKNIILNKSIVNSETGYLIFIDGDCIPHRHFVKEHLINKQEHVVLAGRRVNLPKSVTTKLTPEKVENGYLEFGGLLQSFLAQVSKKSSHSENGIYVSSKLIRKFINNKDRGILGSNFSIHKTDILSVNGFDERYLKPSVGEDTDIELRLREKGLKIKTVKHLAIQYHLFHKALPRDKTNLEFLNDNRDNHITFTPYGILKGNHEMNK